MTLYVCVHVCVGGCVCACMCVYMQPYFGASCVFLFVFPDECCGMLFDITVSPSVTRLSYGCITTGRQYERKISLQFTS
jgi:hypothetical protein